jgi:metallo-beta-lactamase family protein
MFITSYGAVQEVTGSMHLLTSGNDRILLDGGLFQGKRKESQNKNKFIPFNPEIITNIILSHAHIDHSGRLPLLVKKDFQGRIITTRATADACYFMLKDSAHIQESDAEYLNYKTAKKFLFNKAQNNKNKNINKIVNEIRKELKSRKHRINNQAVNQIISRHNLKSIEPLYGMEDAEQAIDMMEGFPYEEEITVGENTTVTFYEAGHILGSAISLLKIKEDTRVKRVIYTGDLGRFNKPIINDPNLTFNNEDRKIDLLIMESTYGNRDHEPVTDLKSKLKNVINETFERGGSVIIPSFAFGRTQEIIYFLHELYNEKAIPLNPVYIDSPLATNITKVFGEHPEVYDKSTHHTFLENGQNPFAFDQLRFIQTTEESIRICNDKSPKIIISASGMVEAGRILHHLRYNIHSDRNTVLIVGYMARNTLGRRILELGREYEESGRKGSAPIVKFLGKEYPLKARVRELGGFSAHGDRNEMLKFLQNSKLQIKKIALVHGEKEQMDAFKEFLTKEGFEVIIPRLGEIITA